LVSGTGHRDRHFLQVESHVVKVEKFPRRHGVTGWLHGRLLLWESCCSTHVTPKAGPCRAALLSLILFKDDPVDVACIGPRFSQSYGVRPSQEFEQSRIENENRDKYDDPVG
jgi:hypothetical protein